MEKKQIGVVVVVMNYTYSIYAHNPHTIFDYSNQHRTYFVRFSMSFFSLISFTTPFVQPTLNETKLRSTKSLA